MGGCGTGSGLAGELCAHMDKWLGETLHGQWGLGAQDATRPSHLVGQPSSPPPPATPSSRTRGCPAACCPAWVTLGHGGCFQARCCARWGRGVSCTRPLTSLVPRASQCPLSSVQPCYSVLHLHLTCAVCIPPTAVHTSVGVPQLAPRSCLLGARLHGPLPGAWTGPGLASKQNEWTDVSSENT